MKSVLRGFTYNFRGGGVCFLQQAVHVIDQHAEGQKEKD